ncbi:MAG TPA: 5-methyltetrahydropteroyltriglutamate--homocysteine S-methyltransferase [Candidatus Avacidaminococcus intestinavium]|uniref:5-methyltetrahydropteroyltriglutamate--homocysteine S-methyltransferase n=1 Tax=Candidatus Avacidaminococcus intestinavium TaxID=2840684 RepID=A0A9D1MQ72_9FIRM|nr:5-methyltetrahydropteroyltriglutamate--homocysteine S-methyltransferase [Candidatus Avacidaminococcus intestinavium]
MTHKKDSENMQAPFKADQVGSLLRPASIKEAREKVKKGELNLKELRAIEDREIAISVEKQCACGMKAATDGEFRRSWWHLDFLWHLDGVTKVEAEHGSIAFHGKDTKAETIAITDKVDFSTHPFIDDFKYLQEAAAGKQVKFTIPSPSMLHLITAIRNEDYIPLDRYKDDDALLNDIALAYKKAIKAFYEAGCRYLQLDDTSWGEFCSAEKRAAYAKRGIDLDQLAVKYVNMINTAISERPKDMVITMHICRGNFRSTWFSSGGYEPIAKVLFSNCLVNGFFLEYDSERAGDFKPLRYIKDQKVVLGLVTSKDGTLEDKMLVKERIKEASQYVPLAQLALSPQCGFSSTEEGNLLTEEEQWAKLALVAEIAKEVWESDSN